MRKKQKKETGSRSRKQRIEVENRQEAQTEWKKQTFI